MTAPSNANTSGLGGRPVGVDEALLVQSLAKIVRREMQNNTIPVRDRSESAVRGVLKALNTTAVTAASAQARIADLEARVEYLRGSRDGHAAHAHSEFEARVAAEARVDRLAKALERIERSKSQTYGHLQSVARAALQQETQP